MDLFDGLVEYLMPLRSIATSFARLDAQRQMVADRARVDALARAIRAVVRSGDVVVEIGTGTGLLAVLAARAGARRVYAIEVTEMAEVARAVVEVNGVADRVEVIRGHSAEVTLPELGDVLVTETLGHLGVDEGILTTVADARQRLLRVGARLIPESIDLMLAPTADAVVHDRELSFWRGTTVDVDLAPAAEAATGRIYLRRVADGELCATPRRAVTVDLATDDALPDRLEVSAVARGAQQVHGVAAWFETHLGGGVQLSSRNTASWSPLLLPVDPPMSVRPLDEIRLVLEHRSVGEEVVWSWSLECGGEKRREGRRDR